MSDRLGRAYLRRLVGHAKAANIGIRSDDVLAMIDEIADTRGLCKVDLGLMEPDPRSGGCEHPTCMLCHPEHGDPPIPDDE